MGPRQLQGSASLLRGKYLFLHLIVGTHRTGHLYFAKKIISPWLLGPTRRATVFPEKNVPPAVSSDPPEVPPYYAQNNEYSPGSLGPTLVGG